MSRRPERPRGGGPKVSERLEAELGAACGEAFLTPEEMALSMKAEAWAREVSELVEALEGAAPTDREGR